MQNKSLYLKYNFDIIILAAVLEGDNHCTRLLCRQKIKDLHLQVIG